MRPILLHICYQPPYTAFNRELCRCRKRLHAEQAQFLVDHSFAYFHNPTVTLVETVGDVCPVCDNDPTWIRSCEFCKRTGFEQLIVRKVEPTSGDVVLVNLPEEYGGVRSKQIKTTRIDGITRTDIERAYVEGNQEFAEKINEYGASTFAVTESFKGPFQEDPETLVGSDCWNRAIIKDLNEDPQSFRVKHWRKFKKVADHYGYNPEKIRSTVIGCPEGGRGHQRGVLKFVSQWFDDPAITIQFEDNYGRAGYFADAVVHRKLLTPFNVAGNYIERLYVEVGDFSADRLQRNFTNIAGENAAIAIVTKNGELVACLPVPKDKAA